MTNSDQKLKTALEFERKKFEKFYYWIESHMPKSFFQEIDPENLMLVVHNLMSFNIQGYFSQINLKTNAIVLCLNTPKADLEILKHYSEHGIHYYRNFVSNEPPPFQDVIDNLRIAIIHFTEGVTTKEETLPKERIEELSKLIKERNPKVTDEEFEKLIGGMNKRFLFSITTDRLITSLDMFFRAKTRDYCQYEVKKIEDWQEKNSPSLQVILAWKNTPKHNFLYRVVQTAYRHNLDVQRVAATYIDPYSNSNILIMSLGLHGKKGGAAWEEADIEDFLKELVTLKYFTYDDKIEATFAEGNRLSGNLCNFLRIAKSFVHQVLTYADPNLYSLENIEEGLCSHIELTLKLCEAFEYKFNPQKQDLSKYKEVKLEFLTLIEDLDTGQPVHDLRRKNILHQGINFIEFTLKTNFYRNNKTALSFRLDPHYLEHVPYNREEKFPIIPYGIFFIKGMHFIGFHIRFKDLSRGGLRTVISQKADQLIIEREQFFSECYNLAFTQHKKNKDIPEGGAKGVILLDPFQHLLGDSLIYEKELLNANIDKATIEKKIEEYKKSHQLEFLYHSQRSYIISFLTLIICEENGTLKAENVIDYLKKPEYIYLGPDENMHNIIIEWIADYSVKHNYKPGRSFITSKPYAGINHKTYGVTSLGVNVYMHHTLLFLGIDPEKQTFTVKIAGGPDGDVAGNQILNFHKYYKNTAKILAITDISGTIFDPEGLDLDELANLFHTGKTISYFPAEKLHESGFLLNLETKREQKAYAQQTLCLKKLQNKVVKEWLSGNEMNHLYRNNVHQTKTDIFIPAGGRPRTLNEQNYTDFLDENKQPTSKAIIEGANLYLTQKARRIYEKMGVLIIKDSSCNKCGVITSSFEVLCSLVLNDEEFLQNKDVLVKQILTILHRVVEDEAKLLLQTHQKTGEYLTTISDQISEKINTYKYELLDFLEPESLSTHFSDPLIRALLLYCPPLLRENFPQNILDLVPDIHKKAIIACYIASHLVYNRGLDWSPKVSDILPMIAQDPDIFK